MISEGTLNHKQHMNLSNRAYFVVERDWQAFHAESMSSFLNSVFTNFYELAEASVSRSLNRRRMQLCQELAEIEPERQQLVMDLLLQEEQIRLKRQIDSYEKGHAFQFYLNKDNLDIFHKEFSAEAVWYHDRPMRYFKAVIEEYAAKDCIRREEIYFRSQLESLQACISQQLLLCMETDHRRFELRPYGVLPDHESTHLYLVGMARDMDEEDGEERIASFRINRLEKLRTRPKSYRSGRLTTKEQEAIRKKIDSDQVQFLVSQQEDIEVRLTEQGMKLFRKQSHLRPNALSEEADGDGYILRFHCTEFQIRTYFFRFGPHAEIISPSNLRKHFEENFKAAAKIYEDT